MNEIKDIYTSTYNEAGRCEHGEAAQRILHLFWNRIEPWIEKLQGPIKPTSLYEEFIKDMVAKRLFHNEQAKGSDIISYDLLAISTERDQWREVAKELADAIDLERQCDGSRGIYSAGRLSCAQEAGDTALAKFNQLEVGR